MLKRKIQEMLLLELNQGEKKFEVIHDSAAIQIVGGGECPQLQNCGTFEGGCPNLLGCGMYKIT
jgi:hypothetical protein